MIARMVSHSVNPGFCRRPLIGDMSVALTEPGLLCALKIIEAQL